MILALVAVAGSAYYIFFKERDDLVLIFSISLVILMISYVFQHQIDQLMTRGVPQTIPGAMRGMLMNTAPHFADMPEQNRMMIEDRMKRWIIRKEFINQNEQDAPEDMKYIMAYYAALLTLHQQSYLYEKLDRIVFYHHPFLTPAQPDEVHIVEVEPEDGTIIISVPHALKGHLEKGYYNLALHAMAEAYRVQYMSGDIDWRDDIWEKLEDASGISRKTIEDYLGLPLEDPWPVAVHHQLVYRDSHFDEVVKELPQFDRSIVITYPNK